MRNIVRRQGLQNNSERKNATKFECVYGGKHNMHYQFYSDVIRIIAHNLCCCVCIRRLAILLKFASLRPLNPFLYFNEDRHEQEVIMESEKYRSDKIHVGAIAAVIYTAIYFKP